VRGRCGKQLENRGATVAALAAASPATATAARTGAAEAEAETATGIEAELEAPAGTEAEVALEAGTGVVLTQMVTKVIAELAAGLPALLMKSAPIAGAEAVWAGRWGEWVGQLCCFLTVERTRLTRFRYVDDISETIAMQRLLPRALVDLPDQPVRPLGLHRIPPQPVLERGEAVERSFVVGPVDGGAQLFQAFDLAFGVFAHRDDVLARECFRDLAEQEHAQQRGVAEGRIVLRVCHPTPQFGTSRIGDAVFLSAARADVGHLDQARLGELVQFAVQLALRCRPHVGHRLLKVFEQV